MSPANTRVLSGAALFVGAALSLQALADSSPEGKIAQKCDEEQIYYLKSPPGDGVNATLFLTNDEGSQCKMIFYAFCYPDKDDKSKTHDCQFSVGDKGDPKDPAGHPNIPPGNTVAYTIKGMSRMYIRCEKCEGAPACKGTFQLWQ